MPASRHADEGQLHGIAGHVGHAHLGDRLFAEQVGVDVATTTEDEGIHMVEHTGEQVFVSVRGYDDGASSGSNDGGKVAFEQGALAVGIVSCNGNEGGHGVDFMAGTPEWHGKAPNAEQLGVALAQLPETLGDY